MLGEGTLPAMMMRLVEHRIMKAPLIGPRAYDSGVLRELEVAQEGRWIAKFPVHLDSFPISKAREVSTSWGSDLLHFNSMDCMGWGTDAAARGI